MNPLGGSPIKAYTAEVVNLPPEGRAWLQATANRPVHGYLAHEKQPPPLGPP